MKYPPRQRPDDRLVHPPPVKDLGLSPARVALCVQGLVPALRLARMSLTALGILCRCRRRPCSMGALARWAGLSAPAVTACVDELMAAGMVERVPSAEDKRRVLVRPTPSAERVWKQVNEDVREVVRRVPMEEEGEVKP